MCRRLLFATLLGALPYVGFGAGAPDSSAFIYTGESNIAIPGTSVEFLEDRKGLLTPEKALSAPMRYWPNKGVPNMGVTASTYWSRVRIVNWSDRKDLIFHLAHPEIDIMDAYLISDGAPVQIASMGQARPFRSFNGLYGDLSFDLPIAPGSSGEILLRLQCTKAFQLPFQIWTEPAYRSSTSSKNTYIGAYVGIMMVMLIYNLFIFFSIRDRSYMYYVLYLLSVCATQLAFIGITPVVLAPDWPVLANKATVVLTSITAITASEFVRYFLHTAERLPTFSRLRPYFYVLFAIGVTLDLVGYPLAGYQTIQAVSAMFAVYLLITAYLVSRQGYRPGIYFLLAWSVFLAGIMIFVLKDWGILPYNSYTKYIMPIGTVVEVVLLSFGLADRINVLRQEKERSQLEALKASRENERIIREQNIILEDRVRERTSALRATNEDLRRTQSQLVDAEKMASLGQLTAGIAHEINNPINFITSNIPPLRRNLSEMLEVLEAYRGAQAVKEIEELKAIARKEADMDLQVSIDELEEIIASIEEGADRTAAIVRGLRNFSRLDEDDLNNADLNEGIRSTLTILGSQLKEKAEVHLDLARLPQVECYAGKVNQVFMNLLTNAGQAVAERHAPERGVITIRSLVQDDHAVITISDNGVGMTEEVRNRIFEPFFTTKDVGEGTGLGLSIAYSIIEKHHGRITVNSRPGEGTEFTIELPLTQPMEQQKRA